MKKLMLLGGSRYLIPAIKAAHELGLYVITADYLPDNYAHRFSDEYINVSITDKDAVLKVAEKLQIDGIMSYATDPGVVTAAYVAEKMGLPHSGSYETVSILQDKGRFRQFLKDNDFNIPWFKTFASIEEVVDDSEIIPFPCIVKPVDSAGSKGVSRVEDSDGLITAANNAFNESKSGVVIVEEFIEPIGHSTDTDSFSIDGELVFFSLNDQWFDTNASNPYTPAGFSWPSTMPLWAQNELRSEVQRLITLLNMKTSIYNIETRVGSDGKAYIMECSPRAGGNRLAEVLKYCTEQDIITASVKAAVGIEVKNIRTPEYRDYWCELILHGNHEGFFNGLMIDSQVQGKIVETDVWPSKGDRIDEFTGANKSLGTLVLRFSDQGDCENMMLNAGKLVKIKASDAKWGGIG